MKGGKKIQIINYFNITKRMENENNNNKRQFYIIA
eukprot:UN06796